MGKTPLSILQKQAVGGGGRHRGGGAQLSVKLSDCWVTVRSGITGERLERKGPFWPIMWSLGKGPPGSRRSRSGRSNSPAAACWHRAGLRKPDRRARRGAPRSSAGPGPRSAARCSCEGLRGAWRRAGLTPRGPAPPASQARPGNAPPVGAGGGRGSGGGGPLRRGGGSQDRAPPPPPPLRASGRGRASSGATCCCCARHCRLPRPRLPAPPGLRAPRAQGSDPVSVRGAAPGARAAEPVPAPLGTGPGRLPSDLLPLPAAPLGSGGDAGMGRASPAVPPLLGERGRRKSRDSLSGGRGVPVNVSLEFSGACHGSGPWAAFPAS